MLSSEPQLEEPPSQFSLLSLFLLVTVLCALLSWLAPSNSRFPSLLVVVLRQFEPFFCHPDDWKYIAGFLASFYALPAAAIVWAVVVDRKVLSRFPTEPGHWLLIILAATFVERAATIGLLSIAGYRYSFPWPLALYAWMLPWMAGALIAFHASKVVSCEVWKHAFRLLGTCRLMTVATVFVLNLLPQEGPALFVMAIGGIAAKLIIADAYSDRKKQYSLLHHVGVLCSFEDAVLVVVSVVQG